MPKDENARPMRGPGGRGMAPKASLKDIDGATLKRLMGYIWKPYKGRFALILCCI